MTESQDALSIRHGLAASILYLESETRFQIIELSGTEENDDAASHLRFDSKTALSMTELSRALFKDSDHAATRPTTRNNKACVLYKVPAEVRKEIFNAVLDLFFAEYPERQDIIFKGGDPQLGLKKRAFAGLEEEILPGLEIALFPDTFLYEEFVTVRIEASFLVLEPGFVRLAYGNYYDVSWPSLEDIGEKYLESARVLTLKISHNDDAYWEDPELTWSTWSHMEAPGIAFKELMGTTGDELSLSDLKQRQDQNPHLPRLRKIVLRFTDYSRRGQDSQYWHFDFDELDQQIRRESRETEELRIHRWKPLKNYIEHFRLEEFELENTEPGHPWVYTPQPQFPSLSEDLRLLGLVRREKVELYGAVETCSQCVTAMVHRVTETWSEPSGLVWNDEAAVKVKGGKLEARAPPHYTETPCAGCSMIRPYVGW